jgi:hypothetical protein
VNNPIEEVIEMAEKSALHEISSIASQLPFEVLRDINQRVGDWLASGGNGNDPYIEQQLEYAKRVIEKL